MSKSTYKKIEEAKALLKYQEIENAKALLKENGYQVDNLWHIDDAKAKFNCTDDEAYDLIYSALTNEATMEQIWFAIDLIGQDDGLELKEEE